MENIILSFCSLFGLGVMLNVAMGKKFSLAHHHRGQGREVGNMRERRRNMDMTHIDLLITIQKPLVCLSKLAKK